MKVIFNSNQKEKPVLSIILLDWSCRESFHSLSYLNNQTVPRDRYEIIWVEYYSRQSKKISLELKRCKEESKPPVIDKWVVMGMPQDIYYHKHLMYNIGIVKSSGEVIAFCDSDAIYSELFVENILKKFKKNSGIVLHLDQVRSQDKKFYPFNYPSIEEILNSNETNWKKRFFSNRFGKTTGLLDQEDPLHSRNYGSCMCAKRSDLLEIGGADEHISYVGHICGPYEMTFRLVNKGLKEVWHSSEFSYHTWHPGSDGDYNLTGPNDGSNISTTSLDVKKLNRVMPLVENARINKLRMYESDTPNKETTDLINRDFFESLKKESLMATGLFAEFFKQVHIGEFKTNSVNYNIILYRDKYYGIPRSAGVVDLNDDVERKTFKDYLADSHEALIKVLENHDDSAWQAPHLSGAYKGFNIVEFRGKFYGVNQKLGHFNPSKQNHREMLKDLTADTKENLIPLIDNATEPNKPPEVVREYLGCNILSYNHKYYAIKKEIGPFNPDDEIDIKKKGVLVCKSMDEIIRLLDNYGLIDPKDLYHEGSDNEVATKHTHFICEHFGWNILFFDNKYYAIKKSHGRFDPMNEDETEEKGVLLFDSIDKAKNSVEILASKKPPELVCEHLGWNIISYDEKYYAVNKSSGTFDPKRERDRKKLGVLVCDSLDNVIKGLDNYNPNKPPEIVGEYLDWNIIYNNHKYYVARKSCGSFDPNVKEDCDNNGVLIFDSLKEARNHLKDIDQYNTELVGTHLEYNLLLYGKKYYAVNKSYGPFDPSKNNDFENKGIFVFGSKEEAITLLDYYSAIKPPKVVFNHHKWNIVEYRFKYYLINEASGPFDPDSKKDIRTSGATMCNTLEEAVNLLEENVTKQAGNSWEDITGNVQVTSHLCYLRSKFEGIDYIAEKFSYNTTENNGDRTPVEFVGWLQCYISFGNCGKHPQFTHLELPPDGYRFTRYDNEHIDTSNSAKKVKWKLRQLYRALNLLPHILKLIFKSLTNGANPFYIFKFLLSRGIGSQLRHPKMNSLVFVPSVPYTFGQYPWVIEIEDTTSLFFPFWDNGHTSKINPDQFPYLPIIKTLLELKSCRAIITHVKSTADSIPKLFKSETINQKLFYAPLGMKTDKIIHRKIKKTETMTMLFTNSWHQNPRSFYIRGGLDVIEAFGILKEKYPFLHLVMRTALPFKRHLGPDFKNKPQFFIKPKYTRILEKSKVEVLQNFFSKEAWEKLLSEADIYLMPSDRIHVVSMLEALSYGMILVASDGWGIEEYITDGYNGMIVKGRYGKVTWMDEKEGVLREDYDVMLESDPEVVNNLVETGSNVVEDEELRD
ncbi:MAG: glycosyltransferase, partial [bacterium]